MTPGEFWTLYSFKCKPVQGQPVMKRTELEAMITREEGRRRG